MNIGHYYMRFNFFLTHLSHLLIKIFCDYFNYFCTKIYRKLHFDAGISIYVKSWVEAWNKNMSKIFVLSGFGASPRCLSHLSNFVLIAKMRSRRWQGWRGGRRQWQVRPTLCLRNAPAHYCCNYDTNIIRITTDCFIIKTRLMNPPLPCRDTYFTCKGSHKITSLIDTN